MSRNVSNTLAGLMDAAASAVDRGDAEAAEPLFRRIVAENPRDANAWHMLGIIAIRQGRSAEALEPLKQACQLDRRNPLYLNTLGVAHGEGGNLAEAVRSFQRALRERPGHAESHYNLGKAYGKLGQTAEAERCYVRARKLDPARSDIPHNLGLLYSQQGRFDVALPLLQEAAAAAPDDASVAINRSIAVLATAGPAAAIQALSEFIARNPGDAVAHAELGRRLLAEGRFAEGWREYAWRHGQRAADFHDPSGQRVLLLPDQGLGDHLFFLRFVPMLRRRAARVAFSCPPKLRPLLNEAPLDDLCDAGCDAANFDLAVSLGDLPRMLEDESTPPALNLSVDASAVALWRERLALSGPGPYLGVTWRAGGSRASDSEFEARGEDPLQKKVPIDLLAGSLRGWRGTVIVLQRMPRQGEMAAFEKALGRRAHDFSEANEKLPDVAALLSLVDEYVGVSNTNMHLRAGIGKPARVLVPFPGEFRWMHSGERSPWFPQFITYRQGGSSGWTLALKNLADHVSA